MEIKFGRRLLKVVKSEYIEGGLYLGLLCKDGEPYCDITINLGTPPKNCIYLSGEVDNALQKRLIENGIIEEIVGFKQYNLGMYAIARLGNIEKIENME